MALRKDQFPQSGPSAQDSANTSESTKELEELKKLEDRAQALKAYKEVITVGNGSCEIKPAAVDGVFLLAFQPGNERIGLLVSPKDGLDLLNRLTSILRAMVKANPGLSVEDLSKRVNTSIQGASKLRQGFFLNEDLLNKIESA